MKTSILTVLGFILAPWLVLATPRISEITGADVKTGQEISVQASGKAFVVVFLSATCPCSDSHIAELKSLRETYPGFTFVGIHSNADETPEMTKKYFDQAQLPFPVLQDQKGKWLDQFKALKTPHAFVLQNGETVYQGGVSNSHDFSRADKKFLREALEDLAKDRKVRTAEGRTLGCAIARGDKNVW